MASIQQARLAQSVEHQTSNLRVVGSSPTVGKNFSFCILSIPTRSWQVDCSHANEIKHDVIRGIYVHRERKDNVKSREVKRLKECALALKIKKTGSITQELTGIPRIIKKM